MNKKLILALVLILTMLFTLLAGCGKVTNEGAQATATDKATETATAGATEEPTKGPIKDVLLVGMDDNYPPMEFHDVDGKLVGFDVEMIEAVAKKLGMKVEYKFITFEGIFEGLKTDKYDCIVSAVSMTKDRLENFEFTKPYLSNGQVIVVKPGDESVKTPEDLAGKKVGVQTNTTADEACKKHLEKTSFELKRYDDIIQTFEAMNAGHIDCIVVDYAVAIEYASKSPDKYVISSAQLTNEPISICFKKGNTALRDEVQGALEALKTDGTLAEISKKWLGGEDYTSNIDETLY